jgi:hypothetical protein
MIKIKSFSYKKIDKIFEFYGTLEFDVNNNNNNIIPNKNTSLYRVGNNKIDFIQKGHFFITPIINTTFNLIPILPNSFILKNSIIFVNCFCFCYNNIKIILPSDVIGRSLIIKRLSWIIERVNWFSKTYLGFSISTLTIFVFKVNTEQFNIIEYDNENKQILLDLDQDIPFPEKIYKGFKEKLRILFKKFLFVLFLQNGFFCNDLLGGFINLLSLYLEVSVFQNQNEILYKMFKDYKNNRKKSTYFFLRVLNNIVKNDENVLSLYYLKLLKNFIVKPFTFETIFKKFPGSRTLLYSDYPVLNINIEEIKEGLIFYLKITIDHKNSIPSTFPNIPLVPKIPLVPLILECKVHERIGIRKLYINCFSQSPYFIYNCKGRLNRRIKNFNKRKTKPPDEIFNYIEFNYNGKLPCHLIINDVNQKMQIMLGECCFWTKLVCLDNLTLRKNIPKLEDMYKLIKDIYFLNSNKDGYSKLVKLLTKFLFNENTFKKFILYNLKKNIQFRYHQTYLNFALGLLKKMDKNIIIDKNIYNPVKYNLKKSLLKQLEKFL